MTLLRRLINFIEPPISAAEAERQARVIRPVYWVGFALSATVGLLQLLTIPSQSIPALVTLAAMLLALPLILGKRERTASALILLASSCINFFTMWTQGGIIGTASRTYEVLVVAAGLILGPHLVLPVAVVSVAAFGIILLAQQQGWIQGALDLQLAQVHTLTSIGLLVSTAVIVYFAGQALRQRANFSEGVVKALPGMVNIFDLRLGRSTWLNRSLTDYLGWERSRLPEDVVDGIMHPEDKARLPELFARWGQAQDGQVLVTAFRMRHANGEWRSFESRDTVYSRDGQGRVTQFIGYIEDVTDKRRAEENLARTERLHAVGQLAGGVAHDFNNVLAPILGHAELLKQGLPADDPRHGSLEAIRRNAERARDLTRRMLSLTLAPSLERAPLELNQVLQSYLPLLRSSLRQDLRLDLDLAPHALPMLGDSGQIERALLNLALNAQDALGGQGRIRISTRRDGDLAVLEFADDGPGMAPEVRARAFEPFFTTKEPGQGTGLGLSSVHAMMVQHQGGIELDTAPGQGCRFRLYFPMLGAEPAGARADKPAWPGTVLLVDDEEDLRVVLRRLLESIGWRVLEAGTGDSALAVAAAERGPISLLLSDIRLPGLRGPELARQLEALRPGMRTLFISGFNEGDGLNGPLLTKPFSLDRLKQALEQIKP